MRRVLFLTRVGEIGGAERVALDLIRHLDRARYEPMLVALTPGPIVDAGRRLGAIAVALPAHRTREPHRLAATLLRLRRLGASWRPDIVHANFNTGLLFGTAAAHGRPVVWHVYDPLGDGGAFERFHVAVQRRLRPDWALFGTVEVAGDYLRTYPAITRHTTVLPGVDVDVEGDGRRARQRLGIPPGVPVVLALARMQRHKGLHHVIAAAPAILARHPDARIVLCGGALFGHDEAYPDELAAQAARLGVAARLLQTGFVDEQTKRDLLDAAAVVVHAADREPFGIAVLEAMATGTPVVVTDAAGPSYLVEDGRTGVVVPRGDVVRLADAVAGVLDEPARAAALGAEARREVLARHTTAGMARAVEAVYERLVAA